MAGTGKGSAAAWLVDGLAAIRLHYCINAHLDDPDIIAPAATGATIDLPPREAVRLLTRKQWRDGDRVALHAVAARLGLDVPLRRRRGIRTIARRTACSARAPAQPH